MVVLSGLVLWKGWQVMWGLGSGQPQAMFMLCAFEG